MTIPESKGGSVDTKNKKYLHVEEKIVTSFNKLVRENGLQSIKVSDIIREAGINRCSFYTHYRDKIDLVEKIEQSILDDLMEILSCQPPVEKDKEIIEAHAQSQAKRIINYFYENGRTIALYAGDKGDPNFIPRIQREISAIWKNSPINSSLTIPSEYVLAGLAGMLSGLFGQWLLNDFKETPDEFFEISKKMAGKIPAGIIDINKGE